MTLNALIISALGGDVGGLVMLRLNLRDAVALARQVENEPNLL